MNIFQNRKSLREDVKFELDLSNYATKTDLKNAAGVETSKFAKKFEMASLKSSVDKLDIDKFKNAPSSLSNLKSRVNKLDIRKLEIALGDLSKLSNVVRNDVVRKTEYNELVKKN